MNVAIMLFMRWNYLDLEVCPLPELHEIIARMERAAEQAAK